MENKETFKQIVRDKIRRPGIDSLMAWLEGSDFYTAPASSRYHGSYPGGLLEHSLNVYRQFLRVLEAFPEVPCSEETAAVLALFHDVCKVNMYVPEKRNRKNDRGEWEQYDAYRIDEKYKFGGHGSKSVFLLQQFIRLTPEEAVAINNHMGAWHNEHCGESWTQYPLGFLLHMADGAATYIVEGGT